MFGYLGIVRRASKEKGRELRIRHGNVISAQSVYLYNCPQFEAASGNCPYSVKKSPIIARWALYQHYRDKLGHYARLDHNDERRRELWYARHGRTSDRDTAKYWAATVLW